MSFTSPAFPSRAWRTIGGVVAIVALTLSLQAAPSFADAGAAQAPPAAQAAAVPDMSAQSPSSLPMGAFFDPTRMSFHQSIEIGASTGGLYRGTAGLYTASFGYKLANPLRMQLDLGAAYTPQANTGTFAAASYNPGFNGLFVKNLSLDWRPGANSLVRFSYHDYRSPLQYNSPFGGGYNDAYSPFGYSGFEQPSRN